MVYLPAVKRAVGGVGGVNVGGGGWREVRLGADFLADDVGFAYPGALDVGEDDGDGVAGFFEVLDEGEDVGGCEGGGGAVVVCYLRGFSRGCCFALIAVVFCWLLLGCAFSVLWEVGGRFGLGVVMIWM